MTTRVWFTGALLLLVGILLVQSLALSPASRLAPLWALLPTTALLLVQLLVDLRPRLGEPRGVLQNEGGVAVTDTPEAEPEPAAESAPPLDRRNRESRIVIWIAWAIGLMYLSGFLISTVLFLLPYLRIEARMGWGRSVMLTGVATAAIYLAFGVMAQVRFPPGILF